MNKKDKETQSICSTVDIRIDIITRHYCKAVAILSVSPSISQRVICVNSLLTVEEETGLLETIPTRQFHVLRGQSLLRTFTGQNTEDKKAPGRLISREEQRNRLHSH